MILEIYLSICKSVFSVTYVIKYEGIPEVFPSPFRPFP